LLGASDRLFHWWHKYRDGAMAWSTCSRSRPSRTIEWRFIYCMGLIV
jgi:hypothetical protein